MTELEEDIFDAIAHKWLSETSGIEMAKAAAEAARKYFNAQSNDSDEDVYIPLPKGKTVEYVRKDWALKMIEKAYDAGRARLAAEYKAESFGRDDVDKPDRNEWLKENGVIEDVASEDPT